jgi:hypothetical protein
VSTIYDGEWAIAAVLEDRAERLGDRRALAGR